ncbi:MAG: DUF6174 domain-containing protein [Bacteroidota bacterium]
MKLFKIPILPAFIVIGLCCAPAVKNLLLNADPVTLWQSKKILSYTMDERRNCFCPHNGEWMSLTVENGRIVDLVHQPTGKRLPSSQWQSYKTVEQLFDLIQRMRKDSASVVHVEYDSVYGYPTSMSANPGAQIIDGTFRFDISSFVAKKE